MLSPPRRCAEHTSQHAELLSSQRFLPLSRPFTCDGSFSDEFVVVFKTSCYCKITRLSHSDSSKFRFRSTTHFTTQHNTTQHNTTQHNTTQHNTTQHNTTQHNTTQHNTTQHNTTQHNTTQHNTTQHNNNTEQHGTTQNNTEQQHTQTTKQTNNQPTNRQGTTKFAFPFSCVTKWSSPVVDMMLHGDHGAAWRRRQRRLRSWWRHEQQSVALALSAAAHHSFDKVAAEAKYSGLRAHNTDRAEAAHNAPRRQTPRARDLRHLQVAEQLADKVDVPVPRGRGADAKSSTISRVCRCCCNFFR